MILNKNKSSSNINNSNGSSTHFVKIDKYNYTKTNKFHNNHKNILFEFQRNISREIFSSSSLRDFSDCSTKKLKFIMCKEGKNANGIYKKTNNNAISRNYDLILRMKKIDESGDIMKLFKIEKKELLIYEIKYFLEYHSFIYDREHQNDNNSNYPYSNETFLDILLLSHRKKLILNSTIKPMKTIQTDITFQKRNILLSWLTEINMKYIKNQNILFLAVKYLDLILYKQNIDINEFQLIGLLCLNLAIKLEQVYSFFNYKEIIALTGNKEICQKDNKEFLKSKKKIQKTEVMLCDILNFDLIESTSILILNRLVQIINIQNKEVEKIFLSIAYFFLEVSLYDEKFYNFNEFVKALSCVVLTKSLLNGFNIKLGFHPFFRNCVKIYNEQIKKYFTLCQETVKELKHLKYGQILFNKYQNKNFQNVINNYLREFINNCCR